LSPTHLLSPNRLPRLQLHPRRRHTSSPNPFASLILKAPQAAYTGSTTSASRDHMPHRKNHSWTRPGYTHYCPSVQEARKEVGRPTQVNLLCIGDIPQPANKECRTLRAELDLKLPQYEMNVLNYPQVLERSASTTIPHLENVYRILARKVKGKCIQIPFMGDSGGNTALVLVIFALRSLARTVREWPAKHLFCGECLRHMLRH
jgi:hypothetical protein